MEFVESDIVRRRRASARVAWGLGLTALALYVVGFFIQR